MSKGMKRFFMICTIVFAAGGVMAIAGLVSGGISGLDKLSDRYDWFIGPGKSTKTVHLDAEDVQQDANGQLFDRIKISGDADVSVSRGSDASETRAVFGDHYKAPEMHISKGVLYIDSDESRSGGVVNISGSDAYPYVEVYVPDDWTIRDIEADSSCGDIDISDVTITRADIQSDSGDIHLGTTNFDKADITTDSGDISIIGAEGDSLTLKSGSGYMTLSDCSFSSGSAVNGSGEVEADGLKSGGLDVKTGSGECTISGELKGTTSVRSSSGDASITTSLTRSCYDLTTDLNGGDMDIDNSEGHDADDHDNHSKHHSGSRKYTMNVQLGSGNLELTFR